MLFALKGTVPYSIAYSTTPDDHTSDAYPSYPLFSNTSGAMYAGVPHYSVMISPGLTNLDTPKSQILTSPSEFSKILSNFISLCKMFFEWQYLSPSTIYLNICLATSSFNFLLLLTYVSKSPEPHTSITKTMCCAVSKFS